MQTLSIPRHLTQLLFRAEQPSWWSTLERESGPPAENIGDRASLWEEGTSGRRLRRLPTLAQTEGDERYFE